VLDMVCYRKHGHNEGDDPSYTQPLVYQKLQNHKPVGELYAQRLIQDGVVTAQEIVEWQEAQKKQLYEIYDQTQKVKEEFELAEMNPILAEFMPANQFPTAADPAMLHQIIDGVTTFPPDFDLHPKLARLIERRKQAHDGPNVDWAMAETLAFGSLVLEGTPVRLSGQDSGRGTFSQRHVEFHDAVTDRL